MLFFNGGMGATDSNDGQNTYAWPSNVSNVPVELIERNSALFVHKKELRQGSGGAGRFRGGLGQEIEFEVVSETPVGIIFMAERCRFPAPGMQGGQAGAAGEVQIDGASRRLPQATSCSRRASASYCAPPAAAAWAPPVTATARPPSGTGGSSTPPSNARRHRVRDGCYRTLYSACWRLRVKGRTSPGQRPASPALAHSGLSSTCGPSIS